MPIVPKLEDFKQIVKEAEESGYVDLSKDDRKVVMNPLSFLRFLPGGTGIQKLEAEGKIKFESDEEIDAAKEIERTLVGGGTKAGSAILSFITAGIDLSGKTNLTKKLDEATNRFLQKHGDPKTLGGEIGEIVTQFGLPGGIVAKITGNVGKLEKIGKLNTLINKTIGKISNKYVRSTVAGATSVARRAGQGGLTIGLTDFAFSSPGRKTLIGEQVDETGKTGRDLAVARLINKIKYAQEGSVIGAGFPIVGKALSLGAKFGLYGYGKVFDIGGKIANPIVALTSKALALDKYVLPTLTNAIKTNVNTIGEIGTRILLPVVSVGKVSPLTRIKDGLPEFKQWRSFSVNSTDDLRKTLKRIDNGLSYFRSVGRFSPEQAAVRQEAEKRIVKTARIVEKLLDSIEKRNYDLVKASKSLYDTKTTSPASMDKYLDDILQYIKGQRSLKTLQPELQSSAQRLKGLMDNAKKEFSKLLPDDSVIKPILTKNLQGYMRKSFGVFTNPNYAVDETSTVFKDAVNFMRNIVNKNKDLREYARNVQEAEKVSYQEAKDIVAKLQVKDMLRYAKTDNKDPIQILTQISKKKLRSEDVLATGEELPKVIRKLLGEENNLRNTVLQTISNITTSSTNKLMFDRLGEMLVKSGYLFRSREAAEMALKIAPGGAGIRAVGKLDGLGLLNSKTSELYGSVDMINRLTNLKGPLDTFAQLPIIKNLLQIKAGTQFGKTVLSPATVTRNFTSASMFVLNRGLIGGRASVTESMKMVVDDIFNAGKLGKDAEKRLLDNIEEGIQYGALDENIVASELGAVLRAIRSRSIKDTDQLTAFLEKKGLLNTLGRIYAGGDNVWKWYGYNWYKSYLADYSQKSLPKMKEWFRNIAGREFAEKTLTGRTKNIDDAIKEAASWYVTNTMPTYSKVPRLIQGIRSIPFFGNFVAFPAEMIRTSTNTIAVNLKEIASNDRALREMGYRGLMGQFVTMGGASYGIKKLYSTFTGITEEMMDGYRRYLGPEFQKNSDLVAITKMNDEGEFKAVDLSTFLPYDFVTRGVRGALDLIKEQKNTPKERNRFLLDFVFSPDGFFGELLSPFINRAIYFETFSEIVNNKKKEGGQIYSDLADWPEIFDKTFVHMVKTVEPGIITTGRQAYYAFKEQLTPSGQRYELEDILLGLGTGVKPQNVDLKQNTKYLLSDYKKIRTEAPVGSDMYRFNRTVDEIKNDFIKQQRFAFTEQQRLFKAFEAMKNLGFDEDLIYDEARQQKLTGRNLDTLLNGEFKPLKYSKPRFERKIEDTEKQAERAKRSLLSINEDALFPEDELDDIMDTLEDADLNKIFPFDAPIETPPSKVIPVTPKKVSQAPITTPPLPEQPQAVAVSPSPSSTLNNGLTQSEMALLSPSEQAIRLKQRGIA